MPAIYLLESSDILSEIQRAAALYRKQGNGPRVRVLVNPADNKPELPESLSQPDGSEIVIRITRATSPGKLWVSDPS